MTKIVEVSGTVGCPHPGKGPVKSSSANNAGRSGSGNPPRGMVRKIVSLGHLDIADISEGHMDLLLAKERLKAEQRIVQAHRGIGSLKSDKYNNSIAAINDALASIDDEEAVADMHLIDEDIVSGVYETHVALSGIGSISGKRKMMHRQYLLRERNRELKKAQLGKAPMRPILKKAAASVKQSSPIKQASSAVKRASAPIKRNIPVKPIKTKTGAFIKKAAEKAKTGLKAAAKVTAKTITAPQRLLVKGLLEVTLPKAAPIFLYLFISDPKIIAKLPASVKKKREKQERIANFIVEAIGMKRNHFMGILRTGIMKRYGKAPEAVLADLLKNKVSGPEGAAAPGGQTKVVPTEAISAGITLLLKIFDIFKKRKEEKLAAQDAADNSDWEGNSDVSPSELRMQNDESKRLEDEAGPSAKEPSSYAPELDKEEEKYAAAERREESGGNQNYGGKSAGNNSGGGYSEENNQNKSGSNSGGGEEYNTGARKVWKSI